MKNVIFFFFGCVIFLPDVEFIFVIFFSLELETVISYTKFNKMAETRHVWCLKWGGDVGAGMRFERHPLD